MNASSTSQNRKSRRSNVLMTATIEFAGQSLPVKLRNLSAEGALIESETLPVEGADVLFRRNELAVKSRVAWVAGQHAGIAFDKQLEPEVVLRHIPPRRPRVEPDFRRPGLACRELTPEERKLVERWMNTSAMPRPGE